MELDIYGDAGCLHLSVASLIISTEIADIRSGTELFQPTWDMWQKNTKFCIRLGDGSPKSEGSSIYTCRKQDVREVSVPHQTTLFTFHRPCVRFQWRIKRPYLHSTGRAWDSSDASNDFICIPRDVREVSFPHQTTLFEFHRTCVRFNFHIKRPYLHSTGRAWDSSDTSNDFICIPRDVREVSCHIKRPYLNFTERAWGFISTSNDLAWISQNVREVSFPHQTTLFEFHRKCVRFHFHIKRPYLHFTEHAWGFSDTLNDLIRFPDLLLARKALTMVPRESKSLEYSAFPSFTFICI